MPKPEFTLEEIEQLQRPEIPLELWRKGEALFAAKFEAIAISQVGPEIVRSRGRNEIMASKAKLRVIIATDSRLVSDFEFFTRKLAWQPEALLQRILADCNMMRATAQSVIAKEKRQRWPIEQAVLENACRDILDLALLIERINGTDFSPARTITLSSDTGERLSRARQSYVLKLFPQLPEVLAFYGGELQRKLDVTSHFWSRQKKFWTTAVDAAREDSVFEKIRRQLGGYHAFRLHRLINAARRAQGLSEIEYRAFVVWLIRLKNRCQRLQAIRDFVLRHRKEQVVVRHKHRSGRTKTDYVAAAAEISAVVRLIDEADEVCMEGKWYLKKDFETLFIDTPAAAS